MLILSTEPFISCLIQTHAHSTYLHGTAWHGTARQGSPVHTFQKVWDTGDLLVWRSGSGSPAPNQGLPTKVRMHAATTTGLAHQQLQHTAYTVMHHRQADPVVVPRENRLVLWYKMGSWNAVTVVAESAPETDHTACCVGIRNFMVCS